MYIITPSSMDLCGFWICILCVILYLCVGLRPGEMFATVLLPYDIPPLYWNLYLLPTLQMYNPLFRFLLQLIRPNFFFSFFAITWIFANFLILVYLFNVSRCKFQCKRMLCNHLQKKSSANLSEFCPKRSRN